MANEVKTEITYDFNKKDKTVDGEEEENKINIFGYDFVKNNKDFCKMIINDNDYELAEKFDIKDNNNNNILKIKLKRVEKITNFRGMFMNCSSLITLPDFSTWPINNITDMNHMFSNCKSLTSIPDISNWTTNDVTDMNNMFRNCSSLTSIPDISKWNTSNVTDMSNMFCYCTSLSSLPDISGWNTEKVSNMSYMFWKCSGLTSLPDISGWHTEKVTNMSHMFCSCSSLVGLPDISKWNTQNVTDFSYMFSYCYSLLILPKTNKWITTNEADRSNMTHGCSESASALKIYIKTMRGETIDIACKMDESISSIKEKLEKLKNIPLAKQKLFYDSRELEDSKSLTDYNIEENMNIHLVANMN